MPAEQGSGWQPIGFQERFDEWLTLERPDVTLWRRVFAWLLDQLDDPYLGVSRADGFDNLWFGVIPDTEHGAQQVVTCSYWINASDRTVRCDSIATLSWPA